MRKRSAAIVSAGVLSLVLALGGVPARAQDAAPPSPGGEIFTDRVDVSVAGVEVVVSDREGRPVHGLRAEDFEVLEDGSPVELTNFFEVRDGQELFPGAPQADEVAEEVTVPLEGEVVAGTRGLLLIVYIDLLHLEALTRNRALGELQDYLRANLGPDDRVMLVTFDGKVNIVERFTDDVESLTAGIDGLLKVLPRGGDLEIQRRRLQTELARAPLAPRPTTPLGDEAAFFESENEALRLVGGIRQFIDREIRRVDLSVQGLGQFSASLAGLAGRKAILYVSQGLPTRPGAAMVQTWVDKYSLWAAQNASSPVLRELATVESLPRDVSDRLRALVRTANTHQVAFYALAPPARGGSLSGLGAQSRGVSSIAGVTGESSVAATLDLFGRETSLLDLTSGTGGLAYTRSFNATGLLDRVATDFRNFYSLGFRPRDPASEDYHRVEVTVRGRPDLEVRHVGGHREIDAREELRQVAVSSLRYAVDSNPLGMAIQVGRHLATIGGQYRVPLVLAIPFTNLAILPDGNHYVGRVTAYIVVESAEGEQSPFQRIELPIRVPQADYADAARGIAGYQVDLTMGAGQHRVAVAVRDEIADVRSSLSFDLDVGRGTR